MLSVHVIVVATALIAVTHARSVGVANEESPANSDTNYAYADQQSEEYAEQPAQNNRQARQAPNDEQGYDKDYAQDNLSEEALTPAAQQAQYPAKLNGDDEDMEEAPKKEYKHSQVAAVNRKSHNHKVKADEAMLNEEADQQEEENAQRQNLEAGDEAKEAAVEDTYRSAHENSDLAGAVSNQRNAASQAQAQNQRQEEESDEAAADTVDKVADYQNVNEPADVQQLAKSDTSAENVGAENAPANAVNYKEYAQEEEETDPANADTAAEVSKEEAAPVQYEQVANQPE